MGIKYYENENLWGRQELTVLQKHVLNIASNICSKLPRNACVGDLGCGDGIILKSLISQFPQLKGYGIDSSKEALKYIVNPLEACEADLKSIPYEDGFFDFCFCIDTLEHIRPKDLEAVIFEILRITKGPVLLVTPFMESDAIKTVCPYCGCSFSPYYHVNQFSIEKWQTLLDTHSKQKSWTFFPLGTIKTTVPTGIGSTLIALGNKTAHQHKTLCPQCNSSFSNEDGYINSNLTTILSPFAADNRQVFGTIYEEMGVLVEGINNKIDFHNDNDSSMEILWKKSADCTSISSPYIISKSIYSIDFKADNCIKQGADLFYSPAYMIDNGKIKNQGDIGVMWDVSDNDNSHVLRLIFPPEIEKKEVKINIIFDATVTGELKALIYEVPPENPHEIGVAKVVNKGQLLNLSFTIEPDDRYVTPYGIFIDLIWENEATSKNGIINLHKVYDEDINDEKIYFNNDIIISFDKRKQLTLFTITDYFEYLIAVVNGKRFDFTTLANTADKHSTINLSLADMIKLDIFKDSNKKIILGRSPLNYTADNLIDSRTKFKTQKILNANIENQVSRNLMEIENLKKELEKKDNQIIDDVHEIDKFRQEVETLSKEIDNLRGYIESLKGRSLLQRIQRTKE